MVGKHFLVDFAPLSTIHGKMIGMGMIAALIVTCMASENQRFSQSHTLVELSKLSPVDFGVKELQMKNPTAAWDVLQTKRNLGVNTKQVC